MTPDHLKGKLVMPVVGEEYQAMQYDEPFEDPQRIFDNTSALLMGEFNLLEVKFGPIKTTHNRLPHDNNRDLWVYEAQIIKVEGVP